MLDLKRIKAVFFDFDDTLGNRERYAYDCYTRVIHDNADIEDPVEFEAVIQDCMLWDQKGNENKRYVKAKLKEKYNIILPQEDFNTYWNSILWEYCVPFEDAEETLEILSKKYLLGLVTNGESEAQRMKLKKAGLERFFTENTIVVSGDRGIHKPDVRIFQEAMKKLNVAPEESVFVGDIFSNDVLGAYRAGMTPVWMWNHGERRCNADIKVIHHLKELIAYLQQ
jgi:putative hydrolase of the HAD superfamily